MQYHLAQLNIGRMLAPMDSPTMAEFAGRLDEINALADGTPGFVWRLQSEQGNATSLRPYEDDWIIVNMSVWESLDQLQAFTYQSRHSEVMRKRRQWFEPHTEMYFVMWWIPAGEVPDVMQARARLEHLQKYGDTAYAFTFRRVFEPQPGTAITQDAN